ncbi:MAG: DsbA family protein [Acidobacteriia bacterium]|nr:DsbA family protein [Terriglobia bacterium]
MEPRPTDDNRSVEEHLATLTLPDGWRPNQPRVLTRVQERDRRYRTTRRRWVWSTAAASVICLGVLAAPASCEAAGPQPCRSPLAVRVWSALFQQRAAAISGAAVEHMIQDFRESGSASAPITAEIYSDYQCPGCAELFLDTMPQLTADYVRTGKVRLVHRDLPLPQHQYAHLAARYANAAGRLGQYDLVVNQLFRTQHVWEATGDVDSQMIAVLPPSLLQKVRALVSADREESVTADLARAREDQIRGTPSLVIVANGKRQVIYPIPSYPLLKKYLDSLLVK